jgi:hypothetical protein
MIYELCICRCIPGKLPALLSRFQNHTLRIWGEARRPPGRILDHADRQRQPGDQRRLRHLGIEQVRTPLQGTSSECDFGALGEIVAHRVPRPLCAAETQRKESRKGEKKPCPKALREIRAGPSTSAFRGRSQITPSCCGKSRGGERWGQNSRKDLEQMCVRETNESEPSDDASKVSIRPSTAGTVGHWLRLRPGIRQL